MSRDPGDSADDSDVAASSADDEFLRDVLGMRAVPPRAPLSPGMVIDGHYRIERKLGAGGMGVVYLARDLRLHRDVAIKLHAARSGDDDGARLVREATAMAQLVHPNVTTVYEVGLWAGHPFIVMEHVDGGSLGDWLATPRTPGEIVERFVAAGRGLSAAHAIGIVHRDFKPDNVLVGRDGRVRVSDFGLARALGTSPAVAGTPGPGAELETVTRTGAVLGTPAYMAPEQRAGAAAGPSADQYAFAVALWEALAGRRPAPAGDRTPVPGGRMPAHVRRSLERALATAPEARFPSMDALIEALVQDPRSRRRRVFAVIAAVSLTATALAAGWLAAADDPARRWTPEVVEILPAYDEEISYPSISPDGTQVAFASNRARSGRYRAYLAPLLGGEVRAITPPEMNAVGVRWMRDGQALLVTSRDHDDLKVHRVPLDGSPPEALGSTFYVAADDCGGGRVLLAPRGLPGCPTCSALVLREPDGRSREVYRGAPGAFVVRASCDPDGRRVVFSMTDVLTTEPPADLWLLALDGGPPVRLTDDRAYNLTPTFHPDGASVVFASSRGGRRNLWELPLDGGPPVQVTFGEGPDIGPAITPDGSVLLYHVDITSWPLTVHAPGVPPRRVTGRIDLDLPQISPDGKEVIVEENQPAGKRIVAIDLDDGGIRVLAAGGRPAIAPDGRDIVYRDERRPEQLFAMPRAGGSPRALGVAPGPVEAVEVGPDGWVHLSVWGTEGLEAWRIPLAGGAAERDAPAPWAGISPAPSGGWRAYIQMTGQREQEVFLVPPGGELDAATPLPRRVVQVDWEASGDRVVYYDGRTLWRLDLATGEESALVQGTEFLSFAAGDDGTLYTIDRDSHVRRMAITNFGDRPRP